MKSGRQKYTAESKCKSKSKTKREREAKIDEITTKN